MKAYWIRMLRMLLLFGAAAFAVRTVCSRLTNNSFRARNIVAQRITHEIEVWLEGADPSQADADTVIGQVFTARRAEWDGLYGAENSPDTVHLMLFGQENGMKMYGGSDVQVCGIYAGETMIGIAEYRFSGNVQDHMRTAVDICIGLCALFLLGYGLYLYKILAEPFHRLSDYPERLSKGMITEKLPDSENPFFGQYVWGINMLSDKLEHDRQVQQHSMIEREQFVTTLVHGIKTPAANIKLLSEAIATGLYDPEGKINEKDAELADQIGQQADEIEAIISRVVKESTTAVFDYDPDAKPFYRSEIVRFLDDEYANRLKVSRIPLTVEYEGNPMVRSDFDGICRILRQLMDNAIKYGDGTGITVRLTKNEEGHFITVSNRGEPLPEGEVHFVFNSLWRGSNAAGIKGSGIGLYEARLIAKKLGGDIRMQTAAHETAVTLFLPDGAVI
ncbi:MAG: HAMP domain-containing histidine kinase [Oscillospiraceae bacterium]|nr:HAMP domain-containing histidine kinase [Oscillospiraceae bacterium]